MRPLSSTSVFGTRITRLSSRRRTLPSTAVDVSIGSSRVPRARHAVQRRQRVPSSLRPHPDASATSRHMRPRPPPPITPARRRHSIIFWKPRGHGYDASQVRITRRFFPRTNLVSTTRARRVLRAVTSAELARDFDSIFRCPGGGDTRQVCAPTDQGGARGRMPSTSNASLRVLSASNASHDDGTINSPGAAKDGYIFVAGGSVRQVKTELCSLARAQHHHAHPRALGHEQRQLPRAILPAGPGARIPALQAHSTTTHIIAPSARNSTDYFERTALERWYTAAWYRQLAEQCGPDAADSRGGAMHAHVRFTDRERAVDASRSTDEKSDSPTPHAARAGAPRESAGWCACVARGVGDGAPAKRLRLVATKTLRAVPRRNLRRFRAR
ncbi:hypothetical protein FB451DRAFT_1404686 [Mycena latifolia]|nr:hypothetical protein FB451DRAFT_1404686 [Mycena latifolia]